MAESRQDIKSKVKYYLRITVKYAFSNIGLCGLVIGYALVGALIFQSLESNYELQVIRKAKVQRNSEIRKAQKQITLIENEREKCVSQLWKITTELNVLYGVNWTKLAREKLNNFQAFIISSSLERLNTSEINEELQWTFSGALLYSVTVITTIGFGNIAPKTDEGKVITIFYALFGIPLMLLFLANIGDLLAKTFKLSYFLSCKFFRSKIRSRENKTSSIEANKTEIELEQPEQVSPPESILLEEKQSGSTHVNNIIVEDKVESEGTISQIDNTKELKQEKNKKVPIFIVMIFVIAYICIGALIFHLWEAWSFLDSAYFCFITLSTIGFGDFVPGSSILNPQENHAKLIICCFYLVIGLAFIAMSFNLVREEVTAICKNLGKKLGLLREYVEEH